MIREFKGSIRHRIYELLDSYSRKESRSIERHLQKIATQRTAEFVYNNMGRAKAFDNRYELLEYALSNISNEGLVLEFGVYRGDTVNQIAEKLKNRVIYGFDSFEGLPEDWRTGFEKGKFMVENLPEVRHNVRLIEGFFEESLPKFVEQLQQDTCSFIHVDCDLYSSTGTILKYLGPRILPGTVLLFDEFFNYPGWEEGEFKAFINFMDKKDGGFEYLGYVKNDEQVAVKIL